jgi:hypothetical protein
MVTLTNHVPSLVVEVAENDLNSLVLLAQQILSGDLDVVECHKSCTSCCRVRGLDLLGLNTLATLDEEDTQALVGSGTCDEVVAPYTVGDPLLGTVDDLACVSALSLILKQQLTYIVLAIGCLLSSCT